ncbi:MAG: hypothetical protein K2X09_01205, partial [Rickettsiales bacterium]|nr:hypothetical protein [Rickettsiales bacterium]
VSHLSKILSDKDHTVEFLFMPQPFNARLLDAEHEDFRCLPPGYMVKIHTRNGHDRNSFDTEQAEKTEQALRAAFSKMGINDPELNTVVYAQDPHVWPNRGVHISQYAMGRICAAIEVPEIKI